MTLQEELSQIRRKNDRLMNELSQLESSQYELSQICATLFEPSSIFPEWECFEFLTKKKGATGPSQSECLSYYSEKYD